MGVGRPVFDLAESINSARVIWQPCPFWASVSASSSPCSPSSSAASEWTAGRTPPTATSSAAPSPPPSPSLTTHPPSRQSRDGCTEIVKKAWPRLRDLASWPWGSEFTQPNAYIFDHPCTRRAARWPCPRTRTWTATPPSPSGRRRSSLFGSNDRNCVKSVASQTNSIKVAN